MRGGLVSGVVLEGIWPLNVSLKRKAFQSTIRYIYRKALLPQHRTDIYVYKCMDVCNDEMLKGCLRGESCLVVKLFIAALSSVPVVFSFCAVQVCGRTGATGQD